MSVLNRTPKFTLWAGPQDGLEIEISPDQKVYFVPGDPKEPQHLDHPGQIGPGGETPLWQGRYEFNIATSRFEWKGYE